MLNKNANCYNIKTNFKYSTVINTFSERITIFLTLIIFDNWNTNKQLTKNGGSGVYIEFIPLFIISRIIKFFFLILLREATLQSEVASTNRNSSASLLHTSKTSSNVEFFTNFFGTNFRHQNKNNVIETISCFVDQLSNKYCVYYVSEHLKYCSQTNEYWLNKYSCLTIVLVRLPTLCVLFVSTKSDTYHT